MPLTAEQAESFKDRFVPHTEAESEPEIVIHTVKTGLNSAAVY